MEKLIAILEDIRPDVDFVNEKMLVSEGILDSFDIITIVDEIDTEYGVEIKPKYLTADNFNSVESIWSLINKLML